MTGKYVVVEGPIGVGKTDVVEALRKRLNARVVLDAPNPFLESFYQDMDKYAFQVQLYFLLNRFQQQQELAQRDLFSSSVICDYLFQKDRLFASLILSSTEYSLYEKVYSLLQGTIAAPDVVVYMQADVETLLDRISKKDEGLALSLSDDYLNQINQAYQAFFLHYTQAPVLILNTVNQDFVRDESALNRLIQAISETKTGIHLFNPLQK